MIFSVWLVIVSRNLLKVEIIDWVFKCIIWRLDGLFCKVVVMFEGFKNFGGLICIGIGVILLMGFGMFGFFVWILGVW